MSMPKRKSKSTRRRSTRSTRTPLIVAAPIRVVARPPLDLSRQLSPHFSLKEMVRSATAERDEALKREQERPSDAVLDCLQYLVTASLEPMRLGIAAPVQITSGYRCERVNTLVGGSATSQHCRGEAADCELHSGFLNDPATAATRLKIRQAVEQRTGRQLRLDVDQNFYLFAHVCLHLEELDVDQVIHEYGDGYGRPAWVHVSSSRRQDKRQILFIGSYTDRQYVVTSVDDALARCCA
jgi:uncharacterized protein YcbK (DUF882 family)